VKNGVPFDRVFDCGPLSDYERMAFSIIFSEIEGGGVFNWRTLVFDKED
jgi:hypothetical protein